MKLGKRGEETHKLTLQMIVTILIIIALAIVILLSLKDKLNFLTP